MDIAKLTQEERMRLAESMVVPIRCGGTEYIDGKLYLRLQGWLVPSDVVEQGWPAIKAYQSTHAPYVLRRRGV